MEQPPTGARTGLVMLVLVAGGLLGAALMVVSIAGLIGIIHTPIGPIQQHLSPSDLASSAVAGATLMLAMFTADLAVETRASVLATRREASIAAQALAAAQDQARIGAQQVEATERHAAIAQETLEASWRPFLVDVPRDAGRGIRDYSEVHLMSNDHGGLVVRMVLRNIGSGPAIISRARLSAGVSGQPATGIMSSVVAPDEITNLVFDLPVEPPEARAIVATLKAHDAVTVAVFYTDQGGHHRWLTRGELTWSGDGSTYRLRSLQLSEEDGAEPFATSGPMFSATPEPAS